MQQFIFREPHPSLLFYQGEHCLTRNREYHPESEMRAQATSRNDEVAHIHQWFIMQPDTQSRESSR